MTDKEMKVQIALGTLSSMELLLQMLSMQKEDTVKSSDWKDNRNPKVEKMPNATGDTDIYVELSDEIVFVFNSKEEFIGCFCYKD